MKITLGLVFGGKSAEHEISVISAKNIAQAADKEKYLLIPIGIDKNGNWFIVDYNLLISQPDNPKNLNLVFEASSQISLIPKENSNAIININTGKTHGKLDAVFCIIHGSLGEDGALQGYFKVLDIPYVGADVLGSSIGMDKEVSKKLLNQANLPIADFLIYKASEKNQIKFETVRSRLGLPVFIKPVTAGSSVGVHKSSDEAGFYDAIENAFRYDGRIIIEEFIRGREIECAILGNEDLTASLPGEVIPQHDFYSYEAKYVDENGAILKMPAELNDSIIKKVQEVAKNTYKALFCQGMARVDLFLKENGDIVVNEINTLPGFTKISMYPKLLALSGIPYPELIDRLIQLGIDRQKTERKLKTDYKEEI